MARRSGLVAVLGGAVVFLSVGIIWAGQTVDLTANAAQYDVGDTVKLTATVTNSSTTTVKATLKTTVTYPNGSARTLSSTKLTLYSNRTSTVTVLNARVPQVDSGTYTFSSQLIASRGSQVLAEDSVSVQVGSPVGQVYIADYWPVCVGDRWHYQQTDAQGNLREVTQTASEQVVIDGKPAVRVVDDEGNSGYFWSDRETGLWCFGSDQVQGGSIRLDPPVNLPATMSIGQSYSGSSRILVYGIYSGQLSWTITITGMEDVTTPAGSFQGCLALTHEFAFDAPFGIGGTSTESGHGWLAKGVGLVEGDGVNPFDSETMELVWAEVCGNTHGNVPPE